MKKLQEYNEREEAQKHERDLRLCAIAMAGLIITTILAIILN